MADIPLPLLEAILQGHVILFIGDFLTGESEDALLYKKLTQELATQIGLLDSDVTNLAQAAQAFEDELGREALIRFLREKFSQKDEYPLQSHQLIADTPQLEIVISSSLDSRLENAFAQANRPIRALSEEEFELESAQSTSAFLYKLSGSLDQGENLLITEEDYESFLDSQQRLPSVLQGLLAQRTLVFLGYDITNPYFQRLYRKIIKGLDTQKKQNYIVSSEFPMREARWCERFNLQGIQSETLPFLQSLATKIKQATSEIPVLPQPELPIDVEDFPKRPYKLLDYYKSQDAEMYFGREKEIRHLGSLIHAHRLTLLYGASGTGKTSLLLAGAEPLLRRSRTPYEIIYVRALMDPAQEIKRIVRGLLQDSKSELDHAAVQQKTLPQLMGDHFNLNELHSLCLSMQIDAESLGVANKEILIRELILFCERTERTSELLSHCRQLRPNIRWPEKSNGTPKADLLSTSSDMPLVEFLDQAARSLECTFVIFLDQFEEFFIRLSSEFRTSFINELGAIYDARDVSVKLVLSLREDWLAAVGEIEERIPEVFQTRVRLLPLSKEQAKLAITAPVERLGIQYETTLVNQLLKDLAGESDDSVMPPQLQLVCNALYSRLNENDSEITLASYKTLGGARGVLQQYLEDELTRLGRDERILARTLLEELVTSEGTKAVKNVEDLTVALDVEKEPLASVLEKLVRARLLRVLEKDDGTDTAYELAHEYLIREIAVGEEVLIRKQTEELIRQEVENWQRFKTLLSTEKLNFISDKKDDLRLNGTAQELILRSAIQLNNDIDYWLERVTDQEQRIAILADLCSRGQPIIRQRIAEALGNLEILESTKLLLQLALQDENIDVRTQAQKSLVQHTTQHQLVMAELQTSLASEDADTRRKALQLLSAFPLREIPGRLRFNIILTRLRLQSRKLVSTRWRKAFFALFVLIALVYGFSISTYWTVYENGSVVIKRGVPYIQLPGLSMFEIDTGIDYPNVKEEFWISDDFDFFDELDGEPLGSFSPKAVFVMLKNISPDLIKDVLANESWGFVWEQTEYGYAKWGGELYANLESGQENYLYLDPINGASTLLHLQDDNEFYLYQPEDIAKALPSDTETAENVANLIIEQFHDPQFEDEDLAQDRMIRLLGELPLTHPDMDSAPIISLLIKNMQNEQFAGSLFTIFSKIEAQNPDILNQAVVNQFIDQLGGEQDISILGRIKNILVANPSLITIENIEIFTDYLLSDDLSDKGLILDPLATILAQKPELITNDYLDLFITYISDSSFSYGPLLRLFNFDPESLDYVIRKYAQEDEEVQALLKASLSLSYAADFEHFVDRADTISSLLLDEDTNVQTYSADLLANLFIPDESVDESIAASLAAFENGNQEQQIYLLQALNSFAIRNLLAEGDLADLKAVSLSYLQHETASFRAEAVSLLVPLFRLDNSLANIELRNDLLDLLNDTSPMVRQGAVLAMNRLIEADVTLANVTMVNHLATMLNDPQFETEDVLSTLNTILQADANLAPAELTPDLTRILNDNEEPIPSRLFASEILVNVGASSSDNLLPNQLKTITEILETEAPLNPIYYLQVSENVQQIVQADPELLPLLVEELNGLLGADETAVTKDTVYIIVQLANTPGFESSMSELLSIIANNPILKAQLDGIYVDPIVRVSNVDLLSQYWQLSSFFTEEQSSIINHIEEDPTFKAVVIQNLFLLVENENDVLQNKAVTFLKAIILQNPDLVPFDTIVALIEHPNNEVTRVGINILTASTVTFTDSEGSVWEFPLLNTIMQDSTKATAIANQLLANLVDQGGFVQTNVENLLLQMIANDPSLISLPDFDPLITSQNYALVQASIRLLVNLAEFDPSQANEIVEILSEMMINNSYTDLPITSTLLADLSRENPSLAPQIISTLLDGMVEISNLSAPIQNPYVLAIETIANENPSVIPELNQRLKSFSESDDIYLRANAIRTIGGIIGIQQERMSTETFPNIVAELIALTEDEQFSLSDSATFSLNRIINSQSRLVSQIHQAALQMLKNENAGMRLKGINFLGEIGVNDEQAALGVIEVLLEIVENEDEILNNRQTALSTVSRIIQTDEFTSMLMTPEMESRLIALMDSNNSSIRFSAYAILEHTILLGDINDFSQVVNELHNNLVDPSNEAVPHEILRVIRANPEDVTSDMADLLITYLNYYSGMIWIPAMEAMQELAVLRPDLAAAIESDLLWYINRTIDTNYESGEIRLEEIWDALIRINVTQATESEEGMDALFEKLTNRSDYQQRQVAARALFVLALEQPELIPEFQERLQAISINRNPVERIWANITLSMLDIAEMAHLAANDPELSAEITNEFVQTYQRSIFGKEVNWAATEANEWLLSFPYSSETLTVHFETAEFFIAPYPWHMEMTGFFGTRWDVWERYLSRRVEDMTWEQFKNNVTSYNSALYTDNFIFYPDKTYILPLTE